MKNNKRALAIITSALLAVTPIAATGLTAFATTITVNKVDGDTSAHSYKAYPIITGTLAEDKTTLTAMQWNSAIDLTKLATALKAFDSTTFASFTNTTTPDEFAEMVKDYSNVEGLAKVFNDSEILPATAGTALTGSGPYTYSATDKDGWYLVRDESPTGQIKSANILEVRGDSPAITPKFSLPSLEKKITDSDGSNPTDANTAAIGDLVYYKLSTAVPDVTGYDKYYFIVNDTLSPGLTYNEDSIKVMIGSTELTKDNATINPSEINKYYVTTETVAGTNETKIKVVFEDFLGTLDDLNAAKDTAITVTFNATLNENASIDPDVGNPNTANLTYSNNPNYEESGTPDDTPDEPPTPPSGTPSDVVGETVEDKVNTYTTALRIKKVDQDGQPFAQGVEFTLTGSNLNKVKVVSGSTFVEDAAGTYWKLNTGAYTTVDPETAGLSDAAKAKYANDGKKYKKVAATPSVETASSSAVTAAVDAEGYITFYGLNKGDYTLEETAFPDGYNKAEIETFTISTTDIDEDSVTWASNNAKIQPNADDEFEVEIVNKKGNTLPSTGGIGTKLFYLFGSLLVAGSVVLLVTKKRMAVKEN